MTDQFKRMRVWIMGLAMAAIAAVASSYEPTGAIEELFDVGRLARLRTGTVCKMFSSYDRTGGNADGFTGEYSYLRIEDGNSVVAEMEGAGCIQRIWFTHSDLKIDGLLNRQGEHIRIYLDGEAEPAVDVPLEQLFSGDLPAFPQPLVGSALGGFYCYVPIPYNNGCKVVIEGRGVKYYQITYNEFHHGQPIESFSMTPSPARRAALDAAAAAWSRPGDLAALGVTDAAEWTFQVSTMRGRSAIIELPVDEHIIRSFTLTLAAADQRPALLRARLLIYWDNAPTPAVSVPLGFFFARADESATFTSLLAGEKDGALYNFFPMPYRRGARIEIQSGEPLAAILTIALQKPPSLPDDYAYFHANYFEQQPTELGLHYPWLHIEGRGHYAGTFMATQALREQTDWLEGDEKFTVDGALVIHGTGTEDYFNCGWYAVENRLNTSDTLALHGYPVYERRDAAMRADMYRWHAVDPVPYEQSIHARIEHGRTNDINADYRSAVFFYDANPAQRSSKEELPAGEEIVAYLGKRIWSMTRTESDPYAFAALEKLEQLKSEAGHAGIATLIDGLKYYLEGASSRHSGTAAAGLDEKIAEVEAALARPAADSLSTPTLTNIASILKRARFDLERHEARARGFQPGDEFIIESAAPDGSVTPPPHYSESADFRSSFAKVDDLRLIGGATRFTYGTSDGPSFARYVPDVPRDGWYQVFTIFSFGANAAGTQYIIHHADGVTTVPLEQRGRPGTPQRNNDRWLSLGLFRFARGIAPEQGRVTLISPLGQHRPNTDIEYRAYADAIRFVYKCEALLAIEGGVIDDFESGRLVNWNIASGQFAPQPAAAIREGIRFNHQGQFFIGTTETGGAVRHDFDDSYVGVIRSRPFRIQDNFISFLIGGGDDINNLYAALIRAEDDYMILRATGRESERMDRVFWDVSDHIGTICYLQIVDNARGPWGHINVDDIRTTDTQDKAGSSRWSRRVNSFASTIPASARRSRGISTITASSPAPMGAGISSASRTRSPPTPSTRIIWPTRPRTS